MESGMASYFRQFNDYHFCSPGNVGLLPQSATDVGTMYSPVNHVLAGSQTEYFGLLSKQSFHYSYIMHQPLYTVHILFALWKEAHKNEHDCQEFSIDLEF